VRRCAALWLGYAQPQGTEEKKQRKHIGGKLQN
jgi:hypothetical protein